MTADPRLKAKPTATISVCLTAEELDRVRLAARLSSLSVSAWGGARLTAALQTDATRARLKAYAEAVAAEDPPERDARASMIITGDSHADLRKRAGELGLTGHAIAQAVFLACSEAEVDGASEASREEARTAIASGAMTRARVITKPSHVVAMVPDTLLSHDTAALARVFDALLDAALSATFEGKGPTIQAGMMKMVQRLPAGERGPLALAVDPDKLRAVALVLRVDAASLATALAIKAAKAL